MKAANCPHCQYPLKPSESNHVESKNPLLTLGEEWYCRECHMWVRWKFDHAGVISGYGTYTPSIQGDYLHGC